MKSKINFLKINSAIAALVTLQVVTGTNASAASITVPNYSFETNPGGPGDSGTLSGWSGGNSGTFFPTVGSGGYVAEDGSYVGFVYVNGNGSAQELTSSSSLATIALNETYTLTVALGNDMTSSSNNGGQLSANIALLANGSIITGASLTGLVPTDAGGVMTDYMVSFTTTGGANAGLIGDTLKIQLGQDAGHSDYPVAEFDNVRLDGTVSAVPEPSTWAMMLGGVGVLGLMIQRRRQQQG
jgi:hypothetical protein